MRDKEPCLRIHRKGKIKGSRGYFSPLERKRIFFPLSCPLPSGHPYLASEISSTWQGELKGVLSFFSNEEAFFPTAKK